MHSTTAMRDAWQQLLARLGAAPATATRTFQRLHACYSAPERAYHNLAHIRHVLDVVTSLADECDQPDTVRLAAWLHDIVYVPDAAGNESRSAALAATWLGRAGLEAATCAEVTRLILLTAGHDPQPGDANGAVLVDADLAILGAAPPDYDAYARAIRLEYAHLPDDVYRTGRAGVLLRFLNRPAVYRTAPLRAGHEAQARRNLARELSAIAAKE
ncbi:MAG: metal-dependent phosphohydrolase [Anaerolineae bacterium]|nr:metal-dependent phosphohydrolase [Anaerolineae bacterium]